jgi:hypothetical protein
MNKRENFIGIALGCLFLPVCCRIVELFSALADEKRAKLRIGMTSLKGPTNCR